MSDADRCISRLDAFADMIPDISFFIKMHITKEATVSSKIEGTQTSFEEVLFKADDLMPLPYDTTLNSLMFQQGFKELLSDPLFKQVNVVRKLGNDSVHTNFKIQPTAALHALKITQYQWTCLIQVLMYPKW